MKNTTSTLTETISTLAAALNEAQTFIDSYCHCADSKIKDRALKVIKVALEDAKPKTNRPVHDLTPLTVGELVRLISRYPVLPDASVLLAADEEGNSYSPCVLRGLDFNPKENVLTFYPLYNDDFDKALKLAKSNPPAAKPAPKPQTQETPK